MRLNERAMLPTSSREWTGSRALRSPVAARAIASFTQAHRPEHHAREEQVEEQADDHEGERDAAVEQVPGDPLAALDRRQALQQVQPAVGVAGRRERRAEGQHALAAEDGLPEDVLPGRGRGLGAGLLAPDLAAGEERPAALAHEVGLAVARHEQDDARAARGAAAPPRRRAAGSWARRPSLRGRAGRPRTSPRGCPPAPRGRRGARRATAGC